MKRTYRCYKYRIFPTKRQATLLGQMLNECCWLYNHLLEQRKNAWEKEKKNISCFDQCNILKELKRERPSLQMVYSQVLLNVVVRLDLAFQSFFRGASYPRFKGQGWYNSFTYPQKGFKIKNSTLTLSKVGSIKVKLHRPIKGTIKTLTIKRQRNKWYACFLCEVLPEPLAKSKNAIGVDVGYESFITLSNGEKVEYPRFLRIEQKALAKAQRKLSKQRKGSPERQKAEKVVARIRERIDNKRNNFCHQVSRKLVNRFGIICIEAFQMLGSNAAWSQFAQYLDYKVEDAGGQVIRVEPAFTSQDCFKCGHKQVKELSDRVHRCSDCGFEIDRDHNAALNILALGLQSVGSNVIEAPEFIRGE